MQMKFPYELSEQRISLLSKEDQRIYRFEHSDFFDYNTKQRCMQEYQNALLERQGYYVQEIKMTLNLIILMNLKFLKRPMN